MDRIALMLTTALAACTASPQGIAMPDPHTDASAPHEVAGPPPQAGKRPVPKAGAATDRAGRSPESDTPAEALGRRTLSTAFVMVGPDGVLTVDLYDGYSLVLRDVVVRARDYCGTRLVGDAAGPRYCGAFDEIAAARPGGGAMPDAPDPTVVPAPLPPTGRR